MKPEKTAEDVSAIDGLSQTTPLETGSQVFEIRGAVVSSDMGSSLGTGSSRFRIKRLLGAGSFGTVSLAWDETLKREVAIKKPAETADFSAKQTFLNEAQLAAQIHHPGVVVVHDFGLDEAGEPFVVYEYLAGRNLRDQIASGAFSVRQVLQLAISIGEALVAVHMVGLTHRDLKPANILLDERGEPHIADFGLAVSEETQLERGGEVAGTYRYMAPEQVRGDANLVDGRTDLWALGVIMYQLLTRRYPFPGDSKLQIYEQVLERHPRPLRQWDQTIPPQVEEIVLKLLAKPIEDRIGSASELVKILRDCLSSLESTHDSTVSAPPRNWGPIAAGSALVAVILAISIYALAFGGSFGDRREISGSQLAEVASDSKFAVGVWTPLLAAEPATLMIQREDKFTFVPGELSVDAEYQVIFRLGKISANNYSLRVTVEPDAWNAQSGLFIGGQPGTERANSDMMTLLGVRQEETQATIQPRIMHFQTAGTQLPLMSFQPGGIGATAVDLGDGSAEILVDVEDGKISRLFLNSLPLKIDPTKIVDAPAHGTFGLYVLKGKCRFTKAEIRITKREQR